MGQAESVDAVPRVSTSFGAVVKQKGGTIAKTSFYIARAVLAAASFSAHFTDYPPSVRLFTLAGYQRLS